MAIKYLDEGDEATLPPAKPGSRIRYLDQPPDKSVAGFGKNLWEDVKGTVSGLGQLGEGLVEHPIDTATGVVKNVIPGVIEEGKRLGVGELLTGHPIRAVEKLGEAAYDKPLTTALSVIPAAGTAYKGVGAGIKALRGAELAGGATEAAATAAKTGVKGLPSTIEEELVRIRQGAGGKPISMEVAEDLAKNPPPPPPGGPKTPPIRTAADTAKEVHDWVTRKYGDQAAKSGRIEGAGRYLENFSQELGTKDLGLQPRQIASMGPGFEGLEKAEMLVDYAREQGYFAPTLTDVTRKAKIKGVLETTGRQVEAVREIGNNRGVPPVAQMRQELQTQLADKFGIDAPGEIKKVLKKFDKAAKDNPTFTGMADLATELNKSKTPATKMGQHAGPTTEAANIVSRINNDALRSLLNPQEATFYTKSLGTFGAHKKLEQAISAAGRRSASARSNQRGLLSGLMQQALDRGGYRIAGNITHGLGKKMVATPGKFKTLPQFFEELAHEAGDVLDDIVEGPPQYAYGGIVGEMDAYLTPKYGGIQ